MTDAFKGGWQFEIEDPDNLTTWIRLEEILDIGGIGFSGGFIDVTNDASGNFREFIGDLLEGNDVSVTVNHVMGAAGQVLARNLANQSLGTNARFTLVDAARSLTEVYTWATALSGWDMSPALTEQNKRSFNMKISGEITFA